MCLLQRADGRFPAGAALEAAAGLPGGDDEEWAWATAVAVAALRTRFAGERAVWQLMEAKALAALARLWGRSRRSHGSGGDDAHQREAEGGSEEAEAGVAVVMALLRGASSRQT